MRTATAYFAGVGTVVVAIAAGLGGGLLLGNIMSPHEPKHQSSEVTRLEQRSAPPPLSAMNSTSQPVPYPQAATTISEPAPSQAEKPQVASLPADPKPPADTNKTPPGNTQAAAAAEPAAGKDRAAPEDSYARARDADIRREARRADNRRKAERRQQWAERRRAKPRDDDELRDVEVSVRQATEQRPLFAAPSFGSRVGLFEQD